MPNTKNFYLRVRILDGLLQSRKGVSIQECLRVINNRLAARGIPPVTSKDTILKDMTKGTKKFRKHQTNVKKLTTDFIDYTDCNIWKRIPLI